ncbi:hypothetical protein BLNAU_8379 [Blattamonas nauphoetae]|uniref:Uncharacterized protein n=1 Tax=Blattamonas nauphoetae TaxID=2049346 RepID=A0ABQ9XZ35_9EUKA|nr:hypothetical protein BLNAU_8379 [Blattamonas nauphoetae]
MDFEPFCPLEDQFYIRSQCLPSRREVESFFGQFNRQFQLKKVEPSHTSYRLQLVGSSEMPMKHHGYMGSSFVDMGESIISLVPCIAAKSLLVSSNTKPYKKLKVNKKIKKQSNGFPIEEIQNQSYQNQFFQMEEHQNQFFQVEEHRRHAYQMQGCDIQSVLLNHQIFPLVIPRPTQESPDQNLLVFNTREEAEYARHVLNGVENIDLKWPVMKDFHNGLLLSLQFHEPMTTMEHCFRAEFMNTLLSHIIDGLSRVCSFLGLQISVDVMLKYEDVEELFRNGNKRFSKAFIARFFPTLCGESYSQMIGGFLRDHAQSMEIPVNGRETPVTVTLSVGTRNEWQHGSSWTSNEPNTEESEMSERTNNEEDDWMDKNEVEDSERHSMTSNWSLGTTMTPQANTSQSPAGIVRNWVRGVSPPANVLRVGRWSGWGECEDGRRIGEMTSQEKEVEESKGGLERDGNSDSEIRFGYDFRKEEEVDDMIDEDDSGYWEEFRFSCDFEEDEEEDVEDGEGRSEEMGGVIWKSDLVMIFERGGSG